MSTIDQDIKTTKGTLGFRKHIEELVHEWTYIFSGLAAVLVPLFFVLDVVIVPNEFLYEFLGYRVLCLIFTLVVFFSIKYSKPSKLSPVYGYISSFIVSLTIVWMTTRLGGFNSPYYAGLNLVIIATNLVIPWWYIHSLANALLTVFMYIVINFIWGMSFEWNLFFNNIAFLSGTVIITVLIRYMHYQYSAKEYLLRKFIQDSQIDNIDLLAGAAEKVSAGDLSIKLPDSSQKDGTANSLATSFNSMMEELKKIVQSILSAAKSVSELTSEIDVNVKSLSAGSKEQLNYTEVSVRSVENIIDKLADNIDRMVETSELAEVAFSVIQNTKKVISTSMQRIENIEKAAQDSLHNVNELSKSSVQISEVIETIIDIADKTNLLSLNASIEAARATEHGRGFAVVAMEIGKLAEKTAEATHGTSAIIKNLQRNIKDNVGSSHIIVGELAQTKNMVTEMVESMNKLAEVFQDLDVKLKSVSREGANQTKAGEVIRENIHSIGDISHNVTGSIDQIANTSGKLYTLVTQLENSVTRFKL
ncbi:MAG: methyl-accepting chemotaxis protein [Leptospiraceae bacterium]|nr:methyl-accepting chemotaxis protein [Leptospiraceae bacterium]